MTEQDWRGQLIDAARRDIEVRTRLARSGELFGGYHPEMEAVRATHAAFAGVGYKGSEEPTDVVTTGTSS